MENKDLYEVSRVVANLRTEEEVRHEISIIEDNLFHLKSILENSPSKIDTELVNERIIRQQIVLSWCKWFLNEK